MQWWRGRLYVGTNRSWGCWSALSLHIFLGYPYPPDDPDMICASNPDDLPLQAEIWRWTPTTNVWERVYQSPESVPIPGTDKFTAREVGYRGMEVFHEPDGTEALYVSTVYPKAINPEGYVAPRILRSTDGETFTALPQAPGTLLGDYSQPSFRGLLDYQDHLYVVAASIYGSGPMWESADPRTGIFREVSPPGLTVSEMVPYNGALYVGTADEDQLIPGGTEGGYEVLKTDASGTPPYTFSSVVPPSAYGYPLGVSVASMVEFKGHLYVGTDSPADLLRVNPDDSWELIVGNERTAPDGTTLLPLSGYSAGFDWGYNVHLWRMEVYGGTLYIGTADDTFKVWRDYPDLFGWQFGYDLWATDDGWYYYPVTVNGFGDPYQWGVRTFAPTPYGLFMGTSSFWRGLRIWQKSALPLFLPVVGGRSSPTVENRTHTPSLSPLPQLVGAPAVSARPLRLEGEGTADGFLLSWQPSEGAQRFLVYRSIYGAPPEPDRATAFPVTSVPGPPEWIATSERPYFLDRTAEAGQQYLYYVLADEGSGVVSPPSNFVTAPASHTPVTFEGVQRALAAWRSEQAARGEAPSSRLLYHARQRLQAGDPAAAHQLVVHALEAAQAGELVAWRMQDAEVILYKLARRIQLVEAGWLTSGALIQDKVSP